MWRRSLSTHLATLSLSRRSLPFISRFAAVSSTSSFCPKFSRQFTAPSAAAENVVSSKVEDVRPIPTNPCKEELEALLDGRQVRDVDYPEGPFGTKESPAVIRSYYDKRIIGCPGPDGDDEHDIAWFWLEKGKPHECPVCSQYFILEVVVPGGDPDEHGNEDQHISEVST
ncbi:Cytochrome c oxidase subunit Vb [Heracleum sosnowskyi]|uniref:Cytochrome c oxidase subunit Vb n=1 Tax=Heracleum sosnowskyi TaxID=360622 RepID=A0AAD8H327_9APIA|nr:Cytochrome c oxidase subunit Vb [Heracleum sosnowskyi]